MAIAIARIEDALPLAGTAFLGGMSQSWLIRRYPEWSWILSGLLIGGGAYTATKGGMLGTVGLGLMTAGSAGLGMALMPIPTGSVVTKQIGGVAHRVALPSGARGEPAPIRVTNSYPIRVT